VLKLVRSHTGVAFAPEKTYLVQSRLAALAQQGGFASVRELVVRLRETPFGDLHCEVIGAMMINETLFFRDPSVFESIASHVLPELIRLRVGERRLRIWSAACSTGQEACSLAILIRERFPELKDWDIEITATDVCRRALAQAREGRYSALEIRRGLKDSQLGAYFARDGKAWRARPEVLGLIRYGELNLVGDWPPMPEFDLILIRNVLIYFEEDIKQRVIGRVRSALREDGYLFLGCGENILRLDASFALTQLPKTTCFRRKPT
jgi:chemotaxis protein methyltransferase CheR